MLPVSATADAQIYILIAVHESQSRRAPLVIMTAECWLSMFLFFSGLSFGVA
jgi:hypothetical protein